MLPELFSVARFWQCKLGWQEFAYQMSSLTFPLNYAACRILMCTDEPPVGNGHVEHVYTCLRYWYCYYTLQNVLHYWNNTLSKILLHCQLWFRPLLVWIIAQVDGRRVHVVQGVDTCPGLYLPKVEIASITVHHSYLFISCSCSDTFSLRFRCSNPLAHHPTLLSEQSNNC
jgi:hypothetical protein